MKKQPMKGLRRNDDAMKICRWYLKNIGLNIAARQYQKAQG
ncbi:hypothetical protein [Foetidibacter luteolus]|nr:hypothetical protein [Foetidibacter luteolus]